MGKAAHMAWKAAKAFLFTLLGLVIVAAALVCALTLWLTPEHLTEIVNREASQELNADVRAYNVRFTFWSSFPHLRLDLDSVKVRSRNLDSIPQSLKAELPPNPDFLAYAGQLRGGINVLSLLQGNIDLHNIEIDSLRVNIVAVTETLNNYDILKSTEKGNVPYFTANRLRLDRHGKITIFSRPSKSEVQVVLDSLKIDRFGHEDRYNVGFYGLLDMQTTQVPILHNFPFRLNGNVDLGFHPFHASAEGYDVTLGHVKGKMDVDVDLENNVRINNFNYQLDDFNITDLLPFLPSLNIPMLQKVHINMNLTATARLTSPYTPSSPYLPSLEVDFKASDGRVSYPLPTGRMLAMRGVGLDGKFLYNGHSPDSSYLSIPSASLNLDGCRVKGNAIITDVFTHPMVKASVKARTDLAEVSRQFPVMNPYRLSGICDVDAKATFSLTDIIGGQLRSLALSGNVSLPSANFSYSHDGISLKASGLNLESHLVDGKVRAKMMAKNVTLVSTEGTVHANGVTTVADIPIPPNPAQPRFSQLSGVFTCRDADYKYGSLTTKARGIAVAFDAKRRGSLWNDTSFTMPEAWTADNARMEQLEHTPEFIVAKALDSDLTSLIRTWNPRLAVKVNSGVLTADAFPAPVKFYAVDLNSDLEQLHLRSARLNTVNTDAAMTASVSGVRRFLLSPTPVPIQARVDMAIDTAFLNQLAKTYEKGRFRDMDHDAVKNALADHFSELDTVAWLVPRNLQVDFHVKANETQYINLRLRELQLDASLRDGMLSLNPLKMQSDFGNFNFSIDYDSSDIDRLHMYVTGDVRNLYIVPFFDNFHEILVMMPAMKNLEGCLSAQFAGAADIFPDMYFNIPSMSAEASLQGRGLTLHQNHFIRKITRMLLIPEAGDIHIDNVDVDMRVRDNLLAVMPFDFSFSNYSLHMLGINNFNGDLAYHVGLFKSPLHIPFAVNIEGKYHNPDLKFGGKHWKDRRASEVVSSMQCDDRVNLLVEVSHYLKSLVHTAATYYQGKYGNLPLDPAHKK